MKTETQIAEENVKELKSLESGDFDGQAPLKRMADFLELKKQSLTHKATCQRFLEFLEGEEGSWYCHDCCGWVENYGLHDADHSMETLKSDRVENKITDLKQAIKLYEDAGIK